MNRILTDLKEKWPRYLVEVLVISTGIFGGFMLINHEENRTDEASKLVALESNLPDPLEAGWKGESVCEVVEENEKVRILKCVFPPGVGHEKHYHDPHTGYTLAGGTFQITETTGSRTVTVPTGYVFKNETVTVHEVLNVGATVAEFLIIETKR